MGSDKFVGNRNTRKKRKNRSAPWTGWSKQQPKGHQRTIMYKKCGRKCFLGPKKRPHPSFPICTKGTCRVNTKGVHAAYIRAKQRLSCSCSNKWVRRKKSRPSIKRREYTRVARNANAILRNRHTKRGRKTRRKNNKRNR